MERRGRTIAVSLLSLEGGFHRELKAGLERGAREAGWELRLSAGEFATGEQSAQIAAFAARREVDAIVLTPCNSASVGPAIEKANRAGIPVFTLDIANTSGRGKVVSHIASDNVLGGRRAGELMSRALEGQGRVIIVTHPGVSSVADRVRGFTEVLSLEKGMHLVGEFPMWNDPRKGCAELIASMLSKTTVDGAFCVNDELALGAAAAVQAAGADCELAIVGYDGVEEARAAIKDGSIYGDVVQHPFELAALTIGAIRDHFAGKVVAPLILAEVGTYASPEARREA